MGYKYVEILEQESRCKWCALVYVFICVYFINTILDGGKSEQVIINGEGFTNTYLLTTEHEPVIELLQVRDMKLLVLGPIIFIFCKEFGIYNVTNWQPVLREGVNSDAPISPIFGDLFSQPDMLLDNLRKYIDLHRELFGDYRFELVKEIVLNFSEPLKILK